MGELRRLSSSPRAGKRERKRDEKVRKVRDYVRSREGGLKGNCFGMQPERFVTITTIHQARVLSEWLFFSRVRANRGIQAFKRASKPAYDAKDLP